MKVTWTPGGYWKEWAAKHDPRPLYCAHCAAYYNRKARTYMIARANFIGNGGRIAVAENFIDRAVRANRFARAYKWWSDDA